MARGLNRLSVKAVAAKRLRGYYADGGGLYLQVSAEGTKSWAFRFTLAGNTREMGLGSINDFTLLEARGRATDCRKLLADRIDPIEARKQERVILARKAASRKTFDECATAYIKSHRAGWKNAKHCEQWTTTLGADYCGKILSLPVADIDKAQVIEVLRPIWDERRETAVRLRGRIEKVLDYATALKYREGANPARWRGNLDHLLARDDRRKRIEHHAAMPFEQVGAFMDAMRAQEGTAARALELTVGRTNEVIGAKPAEFDLDAKIWTVPAERMKAGREHRVPLTPRAVEIVREMLKKEGDFIFPGRRTGTGLSNMAMLLLLRRMDQADITVHGFRSSFRDWASERTSYPREVCEMALAHAVSDQVEAAYRRGDLFEKRRRLMGEWAKHCDTVTRPAKVIAITRQQTPSQSPPACNLRG